MRFNIIGLCCAVKHHLPQAEHLLEHMHTHVIILFAVVCECKELQLLGWELWHLGTYGTHVLSSA